MGPVDRIQHQFLEDREGWIRCRLAETGAGSDPTATPSQRDLVLPKTNHRCHTMQSSSLETSAGYGRVWRGVSGGKLLAAPAVFRQWSIFVFSLGFRFAP